MKTRSVRESTRRRRLPYTHAQSTGDTMLIPCMYIRGKKMSENVPGPPPRPPGGSCPSPPTPAGRARAVEGGRGHVHTMMIMMSTGPQYHKAHIHNPDHVDTAKSTSHQPTHLLLPELVPDAPHHLPADRRGRGGPLSLGLCVWSDIALYGAVSSPSKQQRRWRERGFVCAVDSVQATANHTIPCPWRPPRARSPPPCPFAPAVIMHASDELMVD